MYFIIIIIIFIIIIIPRLYSALQIHATHVQMSALQSVAATRAQMHPLPVQTQRELTRGTD